MAHAYQDPALPIPRRVADLLARMTFEEKVAQLHAFWLILSEDGEHQVRPDDFAGRTDPDQHPQRPAVPVDMLGSPARTASARWSRGSSSCSSGPPAGMSVSAPWSAWRVRCAGWAAPVE